MISPGRRIQLQQFLTRLGWPPDGCDLELLERALTHPSVQDRPHNDRLEFVGDSVLGLIAVLFLQERYPDLSVGEWAALKAKLVSAEHLARIGDRLSLDAFLVLGPTAKNDPKTARSRLADSLEAVLGALYLHTRDLTRIRAWLDDFLAAEVAALQQLPALGNYKVALQEWTQKHWKILPEYRDRAIGTVQAPWFASTVWVRDRPWGEGEGPNLKSAQQEAAKMALALLSQTDTVC
ncbi:MAG: ribonuclease III [Pseudanabaenaceae cyanobacterium]